MQVMPVEGFLRKGEVVLALMPLRALTPNREPYFTMLLQPKGVIEASEERIGHADTKAAEVMCREFLEAAVDKHVDLLVTPEYCLPWIIVADIIEGKIQPDEGAIWVLGCESITPDDLVKLAAEVNNGTGFFYHEPIDAAQKAKKHYIDPLLYVFWSESPDGSKFLSFVVQLKTEPSKDSLDVELRSLYLGETVYSFNRGHNQIGLLSIICSDAFKFKNALVDEYHANCLLIHIQLNQKPAHVDYAAYRAHLLSVGSSNHVELLCLNWARDVKVAILDGKTKDWGNVAGSAWYIPPSKFNGADELVNQAHHRGLYYSLVSQRWHTFYLNYEPQIILIKKQKLMLHGNPQALQPKSCLTVEGRWSWDSAMGTWIVQLEADDGFANLLKTYPALISHLPDEAKASPVAVERAIELLMGPKGKVGNWFHLSELLSMKIEAEESISRVTVHQESDLERRGVVFRRDRLQRAQDAMTLAGKNMVPWPASICDLEKGFTFQWKVSNPHHNVVPLASTRGSASLVYLADQSDDALVDGVYRKLWESIAQHATAEAFKSGADPTDAVVRAKDRFCVVYRRDHVYRVWNPAGNNQFDKSPEYSAVDITGGEG